MDHPSVDIFCRVIDNFGDVGVTWRLARQLATERGCSVRFIIDEPSLLHRFAPLLDPTLASQQIPVTPPFHSSDTDNSPSMIAVMTWNEELLTRHYGEPAEIVIESFGCGLPVCVISQMKEHVDAAKRGSIWLDLEYLSAEEWVPRFHAIPSCEPQSGLDRTLFFPGFSPKTGGLIRERNLLTTRDTFVGSIDEQNRWRSRFELPPKSEAVDLSIFCYHTAPVERLLRAASQHHTKVRFFVTAGVPDTMRDEIANRVAQHSDRFSVHYLPFLSHDDYDRLLWSCSLNFVRGEDSFVRALWSGKPFIWQIYRQEENAHIKKLQAFLGCYRDGVSPSVGQSLEKLHYLWNEGGSELFAPFSILSELAHEARIYTDSLATQADLASNVLNFARAS